MKFCSVNIRGLGGRSKKISLRHMVKIDHPDVLMIQESMGGCNPLIFELVKIFPGWKFVGLDSVGLSGGLITGWYLTANY
jgi:exonuclease III